MRPPPSLLALVAVGIAHLSLGSSEDHDAEGTTTKACLGDLHRMEAALQRSQEEVARLMRDNEELTRSLEARTGTHPQSKQEQVTPAVQRLLFPQGIIRTTTLSLDSSRTDVV